MTATDAALAAALAAHVRDVPDFPQPGVTFRDITPLLADGPSLRSAVTAMADGGTRHGVDAVVGIEARGFILGAAVAFALGAGFVPIRKQGKLPSGTLTEEYELEYGSATIELHSDALNPGSRVLVVDDVLATGGTAAAACQLVRRAGAQVAGVSVLIELAALGGRAALPDVDVHALLVY